MRKYEDGDWISEEKLSKGTLYFNFLTMRDISESVVYCQFIIASGIRHVFLGLIVRCYLSYVLRVLILLSVFYV